MSAHDPASGPQPGPAPVTIVLADDHTVMRSALRMLLSAQADFDVVAEAGDLPSARRAVLEHRPTVLLLDLNMPGGPALPAIPGLREAAPDTQIVVLTMQEEPTIARSALRAGALGYVLKEESDTDLIASIRHAAAGERYLNRRLAGRLIAERTQAAGWE